MLDGVTPAVPCCRGVPQGAMRWGKTPDELHQEPFAAQRRFPGLNGDLPWVSFWPDDNLFRTDPFEGDAGIQTRWLPTCFQIPGGTDEHLSQPDDGGIGRIEMFLGAVHNGAHAFSHGIVLLRNRP